MYPRFRRQGVQEVLITLLVQNGLTGLPVLDGVLVDAIKNYPQCAKVIFGSQSKHKPKPIDVKKLILLLLAVGILEYKVKVNDTDPSKKPIVFAQLAYDVSTATLILSFDEPWSRLPLRD